MTEAMAIEANYPTHETIDAPKRVSVVVAVSVDTDGKRVRCFSDGTWSAMDAAPLAATVHRNLDAMAADHDYHRPSWTADELAINLAPCAPSLDGRDPEGLEPAVQS